MCDGIGTSRWVELQVIIAAVASLCYLCKLKDKQATRTKVASDTVTFVISACVSRSWAYGGKAAL